MGVFPAALVAALKNAGIAWYAAVTTVKEAILAEAAGADVIVAQGMEAGGHRGCFDNAAAERQQVGLFALLPQVVDAVRVPVVATGAIADARGIAAALLLGASAVQIGTAFLRCPEAQLPQAWSDALAAARPEGTTLTRAFSGRAGSRSTNGLRPRRRCSRRSFARTLSRAARAHRSHAAQGNRAGHAARNASLGGPGGEPGSPRVRYTSHSPPVARGAGSSARLMRSAVSAATGEPDSGETQPE